MSSPFLRNIQALRFDTLDLIYHPEDLNDEYYSKIASAGDTELEHQIGRLTNYRTILTSIASDNLPGDIIEFGTWKGFSMLWIAYLTERLALFNKKIIGIDGFVGLPSSEGAFARGDFSDVTLSECRRNLLRSSHLYDVTKKQITVEPYLYSQKYEIIRKVHDIGVSRFVFAHIDCDISESAREVLAILNEGDLLADKCYLLFDDYGCKTRLQD
jgi:hypothetical protein